jgi:hypothetical protein
MKPSNVGYFVGFLVGKSGQPDMARLRAINDLRPFCRKCRVSTTGERPGEFVRLFWWKFLLTCPYHLDLNDARNRR